MAVEVVGAAEAAVVVEAVAVDSTETKIWGHQIPSYHLEIWHMYVRNCFTFRKKCYESHDEFPVLEKS